MSDLLVNSLISISPLVTEVMRAQRVPATLVLLLIAIEALDANRRKQAAKDKFAKSALNICDISDRDSKVHCYCENSAEVDTAVKTECWVFNGGIEKVDPLWSNFLSQSNIEILAFNVRADGGLSFVPKRALRHLRKLKHFSIKYSSIEDVEPYSFANLSSVREITLTKNQIRVLSRFAFYNLPNLTVLTLDENRIKEIQTDTFYETPTLQKLYLTSNNVTYIHGGAFRHMVNLLELELDRNNISELTKECFEGLANLRRLDLRKNKLTVLNSFTFTELWNLQELFLDYNEIYSLAPRTFDGLSLLKKLSLSHNKLVNLVSGLFEGVRGLSSLDLRHNKLRRFTMDNLKPIYDNLKSPNSHLYLEDNALECDCHLAWMHQLRNEAKSTKIRTSLENFLCKTSSDLTLGSHFTYFDGGAGASNRLTDDDKTAANEYNEDLDEFGEEENYFVETKSTTRQENERSLLQIPVELLPCPQDTKTVTDRTYTHPSQNEVKDYRNLLFSSNSVYSYDVYFEESSLPVEGRKSVCPFKNYERFTRICTLAHRRACAHARIQEHALTIKINSYDPKTSSGESKNSETFMEIERKQSETNCKDSESRGRTMTPIGSVVLNCCPYG
ncbi:Connectin [Eumeta japonica]|uniref:Connectin n=1 Tax=Eumeta variegata TaxID=151549 RepID=A0A4C1Z665_EUMVA|nr:Connectin [Eumeta japonica]